MSEVLGNLYDHLEEAMTFPERRHRLPGFYALSTMVAEVCERAGMPYGRRVAVDGQRVG